MVKSRPAFMSRPAFFRPYWGLVDRFLAAPTEGAAVTSSGSSYVSFCSLPARTEERIHCLRIYSVVAGGDRRLRCGRPKRRPHLALCGDALRGRRGPGPTAYHVCRNDRRGRETMEASRQDGVRPRLVVVFTIRRKRFRTVTAYQMNASERRKYAAQID
jgi:hypothetical protein